MCEDMGGEVAIISSLKQSLSEGCASNFLIQLQVIVKLQVATEDRRLNIREWEDYLFTGLLPQSATIEGRYVFSSWFYFVLQRGR
jgi:hypothetical protein